MALFDFVCDTCGKTEEKIISGDIKLIPCECGGNAIRQYPCDSFHFFLKYDPKKDRVSWGNEGYATTQRYREYDKLAKKNKG
jgi:hypothetical protein